MKKTKTNLGYCCINTSLKKDKITTNRGCIKRTFKEKGLVYVSELALKNVNDLLKVIEWNYKNDIYVYRMSSDLFPWQSEYEFKDLPDYLEITKQLKKVGEYSKKFNQRLSFHPGPFNVLGSPNSKLADTTIKEINQHAKIMDLMGLEQNYNNPINIHCNGVYGDKTKTLARWCSNFLKLSNSAKSRLVIENDDKSSMYSVKDLYNGVFKAVGVPVTFDYHHHRFNTGGLSEKEAFMLAKSTWDYYNIKPLFHYSSCKKTFENFESKAQAHADYVYEKINDYNCAVDIEVEAKLKELAVIKYRESSNSLLTEYVSFDEYYGWVYM